VENEVSPESAKYTIQKSIKHRQSFPYDEAAMTLVFMGVKTISRKWTLSIWDWGLNQFAIIYREDRVPL
jgi:transposase-like protein